MALSPMNQHRLKKKGSAYRGGMLMATHEGIPALIIINLLGGPFLTGYLLHLGASAQQVGIAMAVPSLANVMQVVMAFFMQKIEDRRMAVLILGGVLHRSTWVATGLVPFLFPEPLWIPVFLTLYTFSFLCNSAGVVVWTSLIADIVPVQIRGRYFGIRNMILWGVGSLSLFVGGQILEKFPGQAGFNILFAICAVSTVWNIITLRLYPNMPFEKSKEPKRWKMVQKPFQEPVFLKGMLFISLWLFVQGISVPLFSYVMLDVMGVSYQWVSILTMIQTIVMMVSNYYWGNLNMKYSSRTLLLWTLPIISLSCLLWGALAVLPSLSVLFVIHILLGAGTGGFNLMMFNFTIGDTPKSERPMFIAVFSALTGLCGFFGPMLGGFLYKQVVDMPKWVQVYGISVSVGVALLLLSFLLGPVVFKDRAKAPTMATETVHTEKRQAM